MRKILSLTIIVCATATVLAAEPAQELSPTAEVPGECLLEGTPDADSIGKGGGKPQPPEACCDPALEPGTHGNPFCFEGHTCCSDGVWRCNNADATPSCKPGEVCDGSCGGKGDACDSGADCCSGKCKGGKCR